MGNREKLELLFLIRPEHVSAVDKEREVHWMLRRHRTRGEWFNVSLDRAIASAMRAMENLRPEGTATEQRFEKFPRPLAPMRSEEHTSELQSLMRISYAVFCLKK